jgi:hypothetical protein
MSFWSIRRYRRYANDSKFLGPYLSYHRYPRHWEVKLSSGDDEYPGCHLLVCLWVVAIVLELPRLIRPVEIGYEVCEREYGVAYYTDSGILTAMWGQQPWDYETSKRKSWTLPWTQWRVVKEEMFDEKMTPRYILNDPVCGRVRALCREDKKVVGFCFSDYDGEGITADTDAERCTQRLGKGWFTWLGYLRAKKVRTWLNIRFDKEVGPEKGSWKGGTLGHAIEMLPGEDHEAAFRRYCELEHRSKSGPFKIQYLGRADYVATT